MDYQSVLSEIGAWPVHDQLRLVHEVWDRLGEQGHELGLSDGMKAELDRHLADDHANPDDVLSWDDVLADAKRRARV